MRRSRHGLPQLAMPFTTQTLLLSFALSQMYYFALRYSPLFEAALFNVVEITLRDKTKSVISP
tara:strand:- start:197 stop:385 length:189 start_codon:yes stop_codon:yes gene_type:complete